MVDVITLAEDIHHNENRKWWWDGNGKRIDNPIYRLSMLVVSELSEALEGVRKNLNDDKLSHYPMFDVELADATIRLMDSMIGLASDRCNLKYKYYPSLYKDQIQFLEYITRKVIELFDPRYNRFKTQVSYFYIISEIFDFCQDSNIDLLKIIEEKRDYNKSRPDHTTSERNKENGKKF